MNISRHREAKRWLEELPENWRSAPLKQLAEITYGFPADSAYFTNDPRAIPLIRIRDITSGRSETNYSGIYPKEAVIDDGDVLIGMDGEFNLRIWNGGHSLLNQRCCRVAGTDQIATKYLSYALSCALTLIHDLTLSTTVKHLLADGLQDALLPIPASKFELAQIVNVLDSETANIDQAIDLLQQELETLEQLKKSMIYEAVTKGLDPTVPMKPSGIEWIGDIPSHWRVTRVKYIAPAWNGLTYDPADIGDTGTPVLRSGNIQNGLLDLRDLVHVSSKVPEKAKAHTGDILICSRNGSRHLIGKNALVRDEGFAFGAFMMIARPKVSSRYFYYLLNSGVFDFYLPTYLTSTVNQLTGANFGNMVVPIVDSSGEQDLIVQKLDARCEAFDLAIEKKRTQLSLLEQQKKSLIFEYVTGKRRVSEVA